jgi:hypothetical protein
MEKSRVTTLTVARLHNLGRYEHIRYEVTVAVGEADDPGEVLASLENILNDLRAPLPVPGDALRDAQRVLRVPDDQLDEQERKLLPRAKEIVEKCSGAIKQRESARAALKDLGYNKKYLDVHVKGKVVVK